MCYKILILFISLLFLNSCSPATGPAVFNDSGMAIEITTYYEDGHRITGLMDPGIFLWAGYTGGQITSATVIVAGVSYSLEMEQLRTPATGEKYAAFVVRSDGVYKVKLREALEMAELAEKEKRK